MWAVKKNVFGLFTGVVSLFYWILKLLPTNPNKVLCISRQDDKLSLDFELAVDNLKSVKDNVQVVEICCRYAGKTNSKWKFVWSLIISMYHLATSSVCILDAYWPAVSILKHKPELTVIQMWHSVGKIKKSGHQTLGMKSGRNKEIAALLKMHEQYNYVIAGGEAFNDYYCESFNINREIIVNAGLPRLDYLINNEQNVREKIYQAYPQWRNSSKKIVLYAPTFRRDGEKTPTELLESSRLENYIFIMKCHPNQVIESDNKNIIYCPEFKAMELLTVCDFVITDYSAIALEAAALNKKTLYYLYDYEEYICNNGLNLDPMITMEKCAFRKASYIFNVMDYDMYNQESLERYKEKYLPSQLGKSTEKVVELIVNHMKPRGKKVA